MPSLKSVLLNSLKSFLLPLCLSAVSGVFAALLTTMFFESLDFVTSVRQSEPYLVLLLPLTGFYLAWVFEKVFHKRTLESSLVFEEIHNPRVTLPPTMVLMTFFGTTLSHLVGASVGREGALLQMNAALTDQWNHFFTFTPKQRKKILMAALSGGFSAITGAPIAGALFGMEVVDTGRMQWQSILDCFVSAYVAWGTLEYFEAGHRLFAVVDVPELSLSLIAAVVAAGILCGFLARVFIWMTHFVERQLQKWVKNSLYRPTLGGLILAIFFLVEGSRNFEGLGLATLRTAFVLPSSGLYFPLTKLVATAWSIGSGFKGGEYVPLVLIGTTAAGALGSLVGMQSLLSAIGYTACFAGAANVPIAGALLALETFGPYVGIYAFLACLVSYHYSGQHGIYKSQKISKGKSAIVHKVRGLFGPLLSRL